jgi:hypothetical protein
MPSIIPKPITVNLNVTVDASGQVNIFGASTEISGNIIVADYKIPSDVFYDPSANTGLLEFWEPSDSINSIRCQLANSNTSSVGGLNLTGAYNKAAKRIATHFQKMLVNSFDCSGAEPFKKGIYTGNSNYTSQRDFGRLVLSTYADKLFGHQAATSAITNDISLMESMLDVSGGCDANGTEGQRFNSWKQAADISNNDISNWDITQSNTSAKLAVNLTSKIVNKGISNGNIITNTISPVGTLTSEVAGLTGLGEIVKQVLGQDASRAMNQDNNELLPDVHQLLQFHEGDTIYVSIKVQTPAISFGPGSANPGYTSLNPQFEDRTYMIKISLDAPAYSIASPPPSSNSSTIMYPVWGKWLDGPGMDNVYSSAKDSSGNIYILGHTDDVLGSPLSSLLGDKPDPTSTVFLIKYDSSGTPQWGKWIGDANIDSETQQLSPYNIVIDTANNIYINGYTIRTVGELFNTIGPNNYNDPPNNSLGTIHGRFLIKYNTDGTSNWGKWLYSATDGFSLKSNVVTDLQGNIYVTGILDTPSNIDISPVIVNKPDDTSVGSFIIKYNITGTPQWCKWIDGSGMDIPYGIATDSSGNIYVLGISTDNLQSELSILGPKPNNMFGLFLVKYNLGGTPVWGKWLDISLDINPGMLQSYINYNIITDTQDNIYVSGASTDKLQLELSKLGIKPDITNSFGSFLIKYNSAGDTQWGKWIDGSGNDINTCIATDSQDNIYLCGIATNNLQSELTILGTKPYDSMVGSFLIKYNSAGTPVWGTWLDTEMAALVRNITTDLQNIYVLGLSTGDLQSELTILGPKPNDGSGVFLLKYSPNSV